MKHTLKKNKTGQIQSIAFFLITIFSVVFTILIAKYVFDQFNQELTDTGMHTTESEQAMTDFSVAFPTFDNAILMVVILLGVVLIVTSFFIPTHPIFIVINAFGIFFLCFLGIILSDMYHDILAESPELASVSTSFTKLNFVVNYLPWIAAILVFIITIVQFSRTYYPNQ